MNERNLKNFFISATENFCKLYEHLNAPYIRKSFDITDFSSATLQICGLGFYELFINGVKITRTKFAPYISNPDHIIYYDEYELAPFLRKGENVIGVILGNGFLNNIGGVPWGFDKAPFRSAPKVAFALSVDGKEFLHSDETCRVAPSPIIFDDMRCGEYYDFRLEQKGWNNYGFNDSAWGYAIKAAAPKGELQLCKIKPVKVIKEIQPVACFRSDGGYMFDFGVNTAGICRVEFKGLNGQPIVIRFCETLAENFAFYNRNVCIPEFDREMMQKDLIICNGEYNVFEPCFTYHGFRYAFIEGLHGKDIENLKITMLVVSSDFTKTGEFSCSDKTVNDLQAITLNSDLSNFIHIPTDCPQREKNGWTGDIALSCEQFLYNFDCSENLKIWLDNVRKAQRDNGQLPGIIPTVEFGYNWGSGPAWDMIIAEIPYTVYRFTGDTDILTDNAGAIAKYLRYLKSKLNGNGLVAFGLPDWCECGQISEDACSTPLEISDSLIAIEICNKSAFIFDRIGDDENKAYALELSALLKNNFRKTHLSKDLFVSCKTQMAQAKAISVNIFGEEEINKAVKNLVQLVEQGGNRFRVGVLGARVLFRVLADYGYSDLALELITKDGFPSYKYWLENGATSLWEGFNELKPNSIFRKDGGRILSLNHHFWGDISAWFYRYILGINVNPRFDGVLEIDPVALQNINHAEGSYIRNGNGIKIIRSGRDLTIKSVGKVKYRVSEQCKKRFRITEE
nr:family 78 glycoside hydrolase catalytic domain [Clostridia bacterium]